MSGIAGLYCADGRPVDQQSIERMLARIAHRGPDAAHVWCSAQIGLVHCLLHTTPESLHERLPWVDTTADLTITADARIDNRAELLDRLGLPTADSAQLADSRLILAAYQRWGESCPEHLLGDFAFAIWDGHRQQLFCARDPMGIKSFYYHHAPTLFAFASEIKALLCLPEVPRRLNELKVADYLVPVFHDQVSTYYQDIVRLPPAHTLTVSPRGPRLRQYWQLDPTREIRLGSDGEYEEAFRAHFTEAVRCRLRSAFPVGSTLSGGLDSSSIACVARNLLSTDGPSPLHTFSAIFPSVAVDDPRIDERSYMEAVLAQGGFEPHWVRADLSHLVADVAWHKDEAWPAPGMYLGKAIFTAAQEQGVRVLLCGFDGDTTVSYGLEHLEGLARNGQWAAFAREVRGLAQHSSQPVQSCQFHLRNYGLDCLTTLARRQRWWTFARQANEIATHLPYPRRRIFVEAGLKPLAPAALRRMWHTLRRNSGRNGGHDGLNQAIRPSFARRMGLHERVKAFRAEETAIATLLRAGQTLPMRNGLLEHATNLFDHTAAVHGLEQRYPFFDRRLMEFCLALPFEQKLRDGHTRAIFRRAMEGILPPVVQWRTGKGNLRGNIQRRLLAERETIEEVIERNPAAIEPYVDLGKLREVYGRYVAQPMAATDSDLFTIFLPISLALWLRQSGLSPAGGPC